MAFDSNGTYTRWEGPDTWQGDASAGTKILADRHDTHDKDIASALSDCLNRRGYGAALANISMGGFKITNLLDPTGLQDAATYNSVKNIPGWNTSKYIAGTELDGRLNFTGSTGANGITWTGADLSWLARLGAAGQTSNRLVLNNSVNPPADNTGGDVFIIDEQGFINNTGNLSNNISYEGGVWRAITPGVIGTLLRYTGGEFSVWSSDVATTPNAYMEIPLRQFFKTMNLTGSTFAYLDKNGSGKANYLYGTSNSIPRWRMDLGDSVAESGGPTGYTGSNFSIYAFDNAGNNPVAALTIDRGTGVATLNGDIKVNGEVTTTTYYYSSTTSLVLQPAANGAVYVRADGTDLNHQAIFNQFGNLQLCNGIAAAGGGLYAGTGLRFKTGSTGAYGAHATQWFNVDWTGAAMNVYVGSGLLGTMTGSWCDYRIKKDIAPLPSVWDRVKALKPIRYTQAAFQMFDDSDDEQWGFLAHEVQDSLGATLATGEKDGPDVQGLNLLGVIAGLTKALQEAMARIESLEAAA